MNKFFFQMNEYATKQERKKISNNKNKNANNS